MSSPQENAGSGSGSGSGSDPNYQPETQTEPDLSPLRISLQGPAAGQFYRTVYRTALTQLRQDPTFQMQRRRLAQMDVQFITILTACYLYHAVTVSIWERAGHADAPGRMSLAPVRLLLNLLRSSGNADADAETGAAGAADVVFNPRLSVNTRFLGWWYLLAWAGINIGFLFGTVAVETVLLTDAARRRAREILAGLVSHAFEHAREVRGDGEQNGDQDGEREEGEAEE